MGVAGVADLLVPAADMLQVRRRACEQPVAEVDHGAGVAGWRPVDHARVKPSCDWGVRRAGDSYRVSRHLQGCCANYVEDNHLANGCPVRAASITCLIASTVTWACSLFHSRPEWVAP
jgi:hypothetical protein